MLRVSQLTFASILLSLSCVTPQQAAKINQTPTFRADFAKKAGAIICQKDRSAYSNVRPFGLWRQGIYDAQIFGKRVANTYESVLKKTGEDLATEHHYLGYATGTCSASEAWVAALPAPMPLPVENEEAWLDDMKKWCSDFKIRFAPKGLSTTTDLASFNEISSEQKGITGVSCRPKHAPQVGSQIWYLKPTTDASSFVLPRSKELRNFQYFGKWLNNVRADLKLPRLEFGREDLSTLTLSLEKIGGIRHDRPTLQKLQEELGKENIQLLGEDKVLAFKAKEAVWLLWNSPHHRASLLDPKANAGAFHISKQDNGMTKLTFVLARENAD